VSAKIKDRHLFGAGAGAGACAVCCAPPILGWDHRLVLVVSATYGDLEQSFGAGLDQESDLGTPGLRTWGVHESCTPANQ
jgi:hypothetical protein